MLPRGDHGRFLAAITTASLAIQVQNTALGYQMYRLTGDPLSLGMVGLAEAVPFIALALGGGVVADRVDRRRIALVCSSGKVSHQQMLKFGSLTPWPTIFL